MQQTYFSHLKYQIQGVTLFNGSIATHQSQINSEPALIKVSSMINSAILFLLEIIFFGLYFCIQFHIETWFRLIKQDNLPDVLLKDNPEKYKYNPYTIYSEGVLVSCIHKKR